MRHLLPSLLCATVLVAPSVAMDTDVSVLTTAVQRAYGGRAALARVRAYRMEGHVFSAMRHEDVPTIRVFARPDRFKSLLDYEDGAEARVVAGDSVWQNSPGEPLVAADGPMRAAAKLQAARAGLPWTIIERASSARLLGDARVPVEVQEDGVGTRLVGIEIPLEDGSLFRAWIDPTGLVRVTQGVMTRGALQTHFETVYSDFHAVDGVTFAYHEVSYASGVPTGETTLRRVVVNPRLSADEFRPPSAADSLHRVRAGS